MSMGHTTLRNLNFIPLENPGFAHPWEIKQGKLTSTPVFGQELPRYLVRISKPKNTTRHRNADAWVFSWLD